eukprot:Awhi_evm1s6800
MAVYPTSIILLSTQYTTYLNHSTVQQRNSLTVRPLRTMNQESVRKVLGRKCPTCECYHCKGA